MGSIKFITSTSIPVHVFASFELDCSIGAAGACAGIGVEDGF